MARGAVLCSVQIAAQLDCEICKYAEEPDIRSMLIVDEQIRQKDFNMECLQEESHL